jgi:hypothetical protein
VTLRSPAKCPGETRNDLAKRSPRISHLSQGCRSLPVPRLVTLRRTLPETVCAYKMRNQARFGLRARDFSPAVGSGRNRYRFGHFTMTASKRDRVIERKGIPARARRDTPQMSSTIAAGSSDIRARPNGAGRSGRAIPLFEEVLADRQRVLGAQHPDTLTVRDNLAAVRRSSR